MGSQAQLSVKGAVQRGSLILNMHHPQDHDHVLKRSIGLDSSHPVLSCSVSVPWVKLWLHHLFMMSL